MCALPSLVDVRLDGGARASDITREDRLDQQTVLALEPILARDVATARAVVESHIDEAWQRAHLGLAGSEPVAL